MSENMILPQAFIQQMRSLLGEDADAFFASYDQPALRGIRFRERHDLLPNGDFTGQIPYAKNAFYLRDG